MVVLETLPEHTKGQGLPVVHVALRWVIAKDAVHHDLLFPFIEPSVLAAEFACRLSGRGWEVKVGDDANDACQHSFECEKPTLELCQRFHVAQRMRDSPNQPFHYVHVVEGCRRQKRQRRFAWIDTKPRTRIDARVTRIRYRSTRDTRCYRAVAVNTFSLIGSRLLTMKPPSMRPRRARHAKKDLRPLKKACMLAIKLQDTLSSD